MEKEVMPDNIRRFIRVLRMEGKAEKTVIAYGKILYQLRDRSSLGIDDLTADDLLDYISRIGGGGQWRKVVVAVLKRYYAFLVSGGVVVLNPMDGIAYPKVERRTIPPLTDDEYVRIRNAAPREIKYLLEFLRLTLLRVSEALSVDRDSFSYDAIYGGGRCSTIRVRVKGGNDLIVPVFSHKLATFIRERLRYQETVFDMSYYRAWWGIHKAAVRADVQRRVSRPGEKPRYYVSPHRIRAYAATNLLDRGVPLDVVSKIFNHRDIKTTMVYAQTRETRVAREMGRVYG